MEIVYEVTLDYGDRDLGDDAVPTEEDVARWIVLAMSNSRSWYGATPIVTAARL